MLISLLFIYLPKYNKYVYFLHGINDCVATFVQNYLKKTFKLLWII